MHLTPSEMAGILKRLPAEMKEDLRSAKFSESHLVPLKITLHVGLSYMQV